MQGARDCHTLASVRLHQETKELAWEALSSWLLLFLLAPGSKLTSAYSATSPYVFGTYRDDPRFLMGCAVVWLVRSILSRP